MMCIFFAMLVNIICSVQVAVSITGAGMAVEHQAHLSGESKCSAVTTFIVQYIAM